MTNEIKFNEGDSFNDFLAGFGSSILAAPTDLLSLAEGAGRGLLNKAFTDKENPFIDGLGETWSGQLSEAIRNQTAKALDANLDSDAAKNGESLGYFVPGLGIGKSGKAIKLGAKSIAKGNFTRGGRLIKEGIEREIIPQAVFQGGFALLGDGEMSGVDMGLTALAAPAALDLIANKRAIRASRAKILNELRENRARMNLAYDREVAEATLNYLDAKGGSLQLAELDGLFQGISKKKMSELGRDINVEVQNNPLFKEISEFAEMQARNPESYTIIQQKMSVDRELGRRFISSADGSVLPGMVKPDGTLFSTEELQKLSNDLDIQLQGMNISYTQDILPKYKKLTSELLEFEYKNGLIQTDEYLAMKKNKTQAEWDELFRRRKNVDNDIDFEAKLRREDQTDYFASSERGLGGPDEASVNRMSSLMTAGDETATGIMRPVSPIEQLLKNSHNVIYQAEVDKRVKYFMPIMKQNAKKQITYLEKRKALLAKEVVSGTEFQKIKAQNAIRKIDDLIGKYKQYEIIDVKQMSSIDKRLRKARLAMEANPNEKTKKAYNEVNIERSKLQERIDEYRKKSRNQAGNIHVQPYYYNGTRYEAYMPDTAKYIFEDIKKRPNILE